MWLFHCCLLAHVLVGRAAYYHELSMATFTPPSVLSNDSFFGYSMTYYNNELIVSAPRADTNGHVYSCALDKKTCSHLDIKITADRGDKRGMINHDFWLGATVKANKHALFVCAPRTTGSLSKEKVGHSDKVFGTTGTCYGKDLDTGTFKELLKIDDTDRFKDFTHNENITDSFGWSIDIQDGNVPQKYSARVGSPALAKGRVMTYTDAGGASRPKLFTHKHKNGFNFGYSIASGLFYKRAGRQAKVAIGTPYGIDGTGKVMFYTDNVQPFLVATVSDPTSRAGSLFSAALCAAAVDRNAVTDVLLVGAPATFNEYGYHTGVVYVYKQTKDGMSIIVTIEGPKKNGAFFGYAIVNVGDLDHDGKDEIAIAAPYEDDGKGAVYLYSGSSLTVEKKDLSWRQRFQPKVPEFQNFGLSLTANRFSENGCYDLAIGAPGNDSVAVYHCLTVITVNIMKPNFSKVQGRSDKTKFEFDLCLNGEYPDKPKNIQARFSVRVKIAHANATLTDAKRSQNYIEFAMKLEQEKGKNTSSSCQPIKVTTVENGDYEQEIQFEITATLQDDPVKSPSFSPSRATLSADSVLQLNSQVSVAECEHKICEPALTVQLTTDMESTHVIGSSETGKFGVVVHNGDADTAYGPCVNVTFESHSAVSFQHVPQHCSINTDTPQRGQSVICWLQKPLKRNSDWDISNNNNSIEIGLTGFTNDDFYIDVKARVSNRCVRDDDRDDKKNITIHLIPDSSGVRIDNKTDQGEIVTFNSEDVQNGRTIHHTYTITNTGKVNWVGLKSVIHRYKRPYIAYEGPIQIYAGDTERAQCDSMNITKNEPNFETISCQIGDLYAKKTIVIVIPITIKPGALESVFESANGTAETALDVELKTNNSTVIKKSREVTILRPSGGKVPLWMIIASAAVGFLILLLIAFALYECGFLRRQNKQKLENLQKEVKRKSMALKRQSMRMTEEAKAELRNLTFRELLDAAELQEAEEATESTGNTAVLNTAGETGKDKSKEKLIESVNLTGKADEVKATTSNLNGESSVSNLDLRAQLEKTLQQKPKPRLRKSYVPLCDEHEI